MKKEDNKPVYSLYRFIIGINEQVEPSGKGRQEWNQSGTRFEPCGTTVQLSGTRVKLSETGVEPSGTKVEPDKCGT